MEGLRGEETIAELCRREGISQSLYYKWSKEFLEAGKSRLVGDVKRQATTDDVKALRQENAHFLDEVVPLWPNLGRARDVASRHAEQMLQLCLDIANGRVERARAADRLKAAQFVLAIAGVRPVERDERQSDGGDTNQSAIVVSVSVGGMPALEPFDVIDGQARVIDG